MNNELINDGFINAEGNIKKWIHRYWRNNINICHNELVNDGFIDDDDDKDKNNAIAEYIIYYDGFIADD